MTTNLQLIREVQVVNGTDIRTLQVMQADEGVFLAEGESLQQIADDTDTSVMDAVREGGFELAK